MDGKTDLEREQEVTRLLGTRDPGRWECIDDEMAEMWRQKTGEERLRIASAMWRSARQMALASVRHQHPDWTEEQILREVARRLSHGAV